MAAVTAAQNVMLAQKWSEKIDPTGYWMSEKLDGVRAYWSGSKFFSRQGNEFIAPKFFTKDLPKEPLDGELWCGRGLFQKTISIIKKTKDPEKYADDWKYVTYLVFDAPGRSAAGDRYEQRVKWLEENIEPKKETTFAAVVGVCKCTGMPHLQKMLKQVLMKGGEGIMLRQPNSLYETCRSHTLLKVKHFHDEEAKVTGHENGSGRLASLMGKIHCVLPNGLAFKIGSGFTDAQRRNPPKIGSVVSFKYQELSDHGHPRFPTFLRERPDLTWNDVMTAAKAKAPFSSLKKKALMPQLKKMHSILFSTVPSRDQETGKKVVTQDDADEDAEEEADNILTKKALAITLPPAAAAAGTTGAAAAAAGGKKRHAVGPSGKRMCQWGASCYQTNPAHLAAFEHPKKEDEDAPPSDGLVNDELDKIVDPDYEEERPRKKAKVTTPTDAAAASSPSTRAVAAAAAASPSSPSPPSSPVPAAAPATKRACYYGADCYNKDPSHLSRFTHPDPKPAPRTVEEFIQTTNQSQHDLAEYYQFGGDEEEEEVEAILAEDRNERKLSLQRFSDQAIADGLIDADMLGDGAVAPFAGTTRDEDDEVRTVIFDTKPRAPVSRDYFEACASDDEEEDSKTVLVADLPRPVKSGGTTKVTPRVSSTASTQLVQAAATRQQVTTTPTPAVAVTVAAATAASATVSSSTNGSTKKCVYIVPELLSKSILTVEDDEGIRCKRCGQDVGEHRESR